MGQRKLKSVLNELDDERKTKESEKFGWAFDLAIDWKLLKIIYIHRTSYT